MKRKLTRDEVERLLRAFFRVERQELQEPQDLWQRLAGRLGHQEQTAREAPPIRAPLFHRLGLVYGALAASVLLMLLTAGVWLLVSYGGGLGGVPASAPERIGPSGPQGPAGALEADRGTYDTTTGPVPTASAPFKALETPIPAPAYPEVQSLAPLWSLDPQARAEGDGLALQPARAILVEGVQATLFYIVTAPRELTGWQLWPSEIQVVSPDGHNYPVLGVSPLETVGRLSLGAITFSLAQVQPGTVMLNITAMRALDPHTGDQRVLSTFLSFSPVQRLPGEQEAGPIATLTWPDCLALEGVGIGFQSGSRCPPFEQAPAVGVSTPSPPPGIPTPTVPPFQALGEFLAQGRAIVVFKLYTPEVLHLYALVYRDGSVRRVTPEELRQR